MLVWFTTNPALVHPLASRRPHLSIFFVVVIFGGLEFLPQHLELRLCVQRWLLNALPTIYCGIMHSRTDLRIFLRQRCCLGCGLLRFLRPLH